MVGGLEHQLPQASPCVLDKSVVTHSAVCVGVCMFYVSCNADRLASTDRSV